MQFLSKFNPLTADYRKEEPLSVKAIKGATALTPLDSVVEISKELKEEEPDYKKIGLLTAMEAAGLAAPMAKPAMTAVKSSKAAQPFKRTRKAYRIATQAEDGKLYPLFVNADDEIPVGQWIAASIPPITFKGANGNMYVPSKGAKRSKGEKAKPTGDMQVLPDQETADQLREAGFAVEKPSKAAPFGKVRAVASRPGYHATTKPVAHHLGPEDLVISEAEKKKLVKAGITPKAFKEKTFNYLDGKLISKKKIDDLSEKEKKRVTKQKKFYVKRRAEDQVFLEVDMADDTSEELLEYMKARGRTDINDKLPEGGSYTYQDGQADAETWVVGGNMRVNRVLSRDEAKNIQNQMGVKDLPLRKEVEEILGRKFSTGGLAEKGRDMYQGQDDSLLVQGIGMAKGGAVEEQMEMNFGKVPDNTIGIDPVSGNEIPLGSTAENVRDDIPANLSEGEIVVPADVVNFHGVKLFEDLRREAKMGYAEMAEDGRIGGEPMDMDEPVEEDELGLELADLEIIELSEDPVTMDKGGYNSKPPKFKNRYEKIMYYLTKFMQDEEEEEKKLKGPSIAEQINFGGKYNEGGMASDEQPFYSQKGGFDMSRADVPMGSPIGDTGTVPTGMVELREYMNDAGHKIVITFVDGEPTTDIPVGYYPVSTIVTPSPSVATSSDRDDKPSMPMPEGINYKQLSVQELTDMVSGQQDSKITNMVSKLAMASNPVMGVLMKVAMADQSRKLKSEVQRRLDDPATTDLDRMKLNNLMEIEGESTFIERLFGKEPAKMIAKPKDNEAFVAAAIADPEKFLAPVEDVYEPEVTTPEVSGLDPEIMKQVEQASKEAAEIAFGDRVSTPEPTPVNEMSDRVKQARQNTQKVMKDMRDRGASREERTESLKAAARTEQVLKDMDRGIIRGFEKGGLMKSKKKKSTKNKK